MKYKLSSLVLALLTTGCGANQSRESMDAQSNVTVRNLTAENLIMDNAAVEGAAVPSSPGDNDVVASPQPPPKPEKPPKP